MTQIDLSGGVHTRDYIDAVIVEDTESPDVKAKIATVTVGGRKIMERYSFAYNESDENVQLAIESDLLEKGYSW